MTKEELMELVSRRYDALQALGRQDNFYDYEKEFEQIWLEVGREALERSFGPLSEEQRKKRIETRFGDITISHEHPYCKRGKGFRLSPYLQEPVVFAGHLDVYTRGAEILEKFLGVRPGVSTVYRVTNSSGRPSRKRFMRRRQLCRWIAAKWFTPK